MNDIQLKLDALTTPTTTLSQPQLQFLLAEYAALREEVLKRIEIEHQLISLALIAAGTFITLGLQLGSITAMLAYPLLALFLASTWVRNEVRIQQLANYIKNRVEDQLLDGYSGWEHKRQTSFIASGLRAFKLLGSRGVLIGTQLSVVFVALLKTQFAGEDIALLVIDSIAIIITAFLLRRQEIIKLAEV
jgi:hypothetical protein